MQFDVNVNRSGRRFSRILVSLGLLLAALVVLAVTAPPGLAASSTPGWRLSKTLPVGSTLYKVSATSGMALAIGEQPPADGSGMKDPLIMRFDGSRWSESPVPGISELVALYPELALQGIGMEQIVGLRLGGVFARTASDAWVVGTLLAEWPGSLKASGDHPWVGFPVALHWDGTAWRAMPSPGLYRFPGSRNGYFNDVVAFGPDDVWAVGSRGMQDDDLPAYQPLAMHWDGSDWTLQSPPAVLDGANGGLTDAVRTPWAETLWTLVDLDDPEDDVDFGGFVDRFRSGSWTQIATPEDVGLADVAVIAWNDVWVIGSGTAVLHRDSGRWSVVPTPQAPAGGFRVRSAISGVSSNDVWAVGSGREPGAPQHALIQHWDGSSWTDVPAPPGAGVGLLDVAMRRSGWGWAIGNAGSSNRERYGVILRYRP